jgi:predicted nucleotide-binding protein
MTSRKHESATTQEPLITPTIALARLKKLLAQIDELRSKGRDSNDLATWASNIRLVLNGFYGRDSLQLREFNRIDFRPRAYYDGMPQSKFEQTFLSGLEQASGFLSSRIEEINEIVLTGPANSTPTKIGSHPHPSSETKAAFVVHGRDHGTKEAVARFLEKLEIQPIILHEQADRGRTIVEKFEKHASQVGYAVVILTGDDVAHPKDNPDQTELRARQNVVLELGYFIGALGRTHTFALVEKDVSLPSDIHGVLYIKLEDANWRMLLAKELKAAGLEIDMNKAL